MRALLILALLVLLVGGGLKLAGVPLPFIDYDIGPVGGDRAPGVGPVEIEPPGFGDFEAP